MTKTQKKRVVSTIKAFDRLAGMFEVNGANRKKTVKGYRFVCKLRMY